MTPQRSKLRCPRTGESARGAAARSGSAIGLRRNAMRDETHCCTSKVISDGEEAPVCPIGFSLPPPWARHGDSISCLTSAGMPSNRFLLVISRRRPNGSRLSCGALKKDSFLNLRAASFKRLLGGAPSDPAAEPELQRLVRGVDTHGAAFEDLPQLGAWYTQDLARGGTDLEKRGHQRAEIREMLQQ